MREDLLRFKKDQKYLIFDYETCNLNLGLELNKPWQLAYITAKGKFANEKFDSWLSWPEINVSKGAARVTGFTMQKYDKLKSDPQKALDEFEKYLYDPEYIIIGHNILGFDVYIHNIHRSLCGKRPDYSYINRALDTNCIARAIKSNIKFEDGDDFLSWQYRLLHHRTRGVKTNLKQMCLEYDIDFNPSKLHNALYDIEVNFEVFKKMIWDIEI